MSEKKKLTTLLNETALNGELKKFSNLDIEIDTNTLFLNYAVNFSECNFSLPTGSSVSNLFIKTDQGVRFEKCVISAGITIWGKDGAAGYDVLEKKGPNVFFEECKWLQYSAKFTTDATVIVDPQLQISGYINHFRSTPTSETKNLKLTISQCRFDRVDLVGSHSSVQIVEYLGNQLSFKDLRISFLWVRESMVEYIKYIEIDEKSVLAIADAFEMQKSLSPHDIDVLKNLMDVFSKKREGFSFLKMNSVFCRFAPTDTVSSFITIRIFKNFYSLFPFISIFLILILGFALVYYPIVCVVSESLLTSLFAISGNPIFDKSSRISSFIQGTQAFIGIFYVIFFSWVFGRKYSNYL